MRLRSALALLAVLILVQGCSTVQAIRANILDDRGNAAEDRGAYEQAIEMRRQALRISQDLWGEPNRTVASRLTSLAGTYREMGDYANARPLYERALAMYEAAHSPPSSVGVALANYGGLLLDTGNYTAARRIIEQDLATIEQAYGPEDPEVAIKLSVLGRLLHRVGDYEAARSLYERALRMGERIKGAEHFVSRRLRDLGDLAFDTGDYDVAARYYEEDLRINDPERRLYDDYVLRRWRWAPQMPYLPINFSFYEYRLGPDAAASLGRVARVREAKGDAAAARPLYAEALRRKESFYGANHPQLAYSLLPLARVEARRDRTVARRLYERVLQILRPASLPEQLWQAELGLGRIAEAEDRLAEALDLYQAAVRTLEGLAGQFGEGASRSRYLQASERFDAYEALAGLLLKLHMRNPAQGYDRQAWAVIEAKKARMTAEALSALRPELRDAAAGEAANRVRGMFDHLVGVEASLHAEQAKPTEEQRPHVIEALTTRLARSRAEYTEQVQLFLARYPRYKTLFVDQQTVDPRLLVKLASRLSPNTLVLEYVSTADALYIFSVASDRRFEVRTHGVPQGLLYDRIKRYRKYLERAARQRLTWTDDGSEEYRRDVLPLKQLTRELATDLLQPVDDELRLYRNVIIIPNDLLLYLPFHALGMEAVDGAWTFLADTHLVSYLTQLEVLDVLRHERPASRPPLLAVGDPDGSLPAAAAEVRALRNLRPAVTTLEGAQATKATFLDLSGDFSDFHLATHGVLDPGRPDQSYLVLAGADEDSQHLALREIAGLNFQPNGLVVLSACDTAVGEQVPGAALMTFAAAFSQAGAESIVASLWKVNDLAARDFMVAFHRGLETLDRASALQRAQLALRRNPRTAHPFYWAPFILFGAR